MTSVVETAGPVTVLDHVQIEMADGVNLSARIWLPADALVHPVPALLEYLPYRKGDWTAPRDAQRHPWYAARGYASVRVDLRGSGDSEGVMVDEYSEVELADGVAVIHWLSRQPWCTGAVGMFGISWGGFNSLQLASMAPEPLKAVVTVCSTDDRYADDVHYFGGAVLGIDMAGWATTMLAFTARPPDPATVGPRWRALWQQRLDALEPFLDTWLRHQERDAYWRHGSVCEDYGAIGAAVLAVGGWADPYRNTVFRLLENLPGPVKGIIGPWSHQYPDRDAEPGPAIGFLQETLRWWDHWLKGRPTGVTDDPALRVWMQDSVPPATRYAVRPGRWIGEVTWPSPAVTPARFELRGMRCTAAQDDAVVVATAQHTGADAGRYFPFGNAADLPPDQRAEDGRSVCLDTAPLTEPIELLGRPSVRLTLTASAAAHVVTRLCDVAPDGRSTLVTRGVLNLRSRDGMASDVAVVPGARMVVDLPMVATGWSIPRGHRLRLSLSTTYWPWVWPHPGEAVLEIDLARSVLTLPVRDRGDAGVPVHFEPPDQAPPLAVTIPRAEGRRAEREVTYEPATGRWTLTVDPKYGGDRRYPDGLDYREQAVESYSIVDGDPLSATAASTWRIGLARPGWQVGIEVDAEMTADSTHFRTVHRVHAECDGDTVFDRTWHGRIPRTSC